MGSIFFLGTFSLSNKECKKKRGGIAIEYEEGKKKGEICFHLEKHTHVQYVQQKSLGTSVQKAVFYQHRF